MSSLFIPMSIVIVRHDVDDVKVLVELWYIVSVINDLFGWGHGGCEQKTPWFELST